MTKEAMKRALCVYLDAFENHLITNATSSNLDMTGHIAELVKEALANHIEDNLVMVQEPIGEAHLMQSGFTHCIWSETCVPVGTKLYTTPPQRPWVGLTKDEMLAVVHYSQLDNARAIEAKLRELNNA